MKSEHENSQSSRISRGAQPDREVMRQKLSNEFICFHQRRRRNRMLIAVVPIAALLFVGLLRIYEQPAKIAGGNPQAPAPPTQPELTECRLQFELISDDQMLDLLSEAGQPSALVWRNGKATVVPLTQKPSL